MPHAVTPRWWVAHRRSSEGAMPSPAITSPGVRRWLRRALLAALTVYVLAFTARVYSRRYVTFLPDYARWVMGGAAPLIGAHAYAPVRIDRRPFRTQLGRRQCR
jgi:hypothetical protein